MTEREEKYLDRAVKCGLLSPAWTRCKITAQPFGAESVLVSRDGETWVSVVDAADLSARDSDG